MRAQDAAVAARRKARGKGGERRGEMTLQERFNDVRDFWTRLPRTHRRALLRVPIRRLLEGARPSEVWVEMWAPHRFMELAW